MRTLIFFTLSLFHWIVLPAQNLTGRWIGVHTEWDLNSYCPLPVYMDFNADSTWQLGLLDESAAPRTSRWGRLAKDSLRFMETSYAPELITLEGDYLRIGRSMPMLFRRYKPVPMQRETVRARLLGQLWQSDTVQYRFAADGRVALRNRRTGEQTLHYAEVLTLGESVFLLVRGSHSGREGDVRVFWQVVTNAVGEIRMAGGFGKNIGVETLRWVRALEANESLQPTHFQACTNCSIQNQIVVFKGLDVLNKRKALALFQQYYQRVETPNQSGIVTLKFVRNCTGDLGPITLQELGADYKRRPFDKRVTEQLVAIVRNQLPSSLFGDVVSQPRDQTVVFTIRLLDGRLTDLF